ncbi:UNVERIFIED_CONTAM: hypothetical protein Sangu_2606300 [Sesamum angustifolium]|uniref:NAC domain-containing protein n=1 Tax=Sesamum angustifolium TaxID=2727405 RepID=A0AAW2J567_9LAMI
MHEQLEEDQEDWYFFTPISREYLNEQRPERTAGNRHSGGVKTEWKMHEYLSKEQKDHIIHEIPALAPATTSMQLNEWVLCKIYHNRRSGKKRKTMDHVDEDNDLE